MSAVSDVCMGVRRSLDMVIELIQEGAAPLYTSGPLIHNPQVLDYLTEQGVANLPAEGLVAHTQEGVEPGGKVVIRAHGVPPRDLQAYADYGYTVLDGTCPWVVRSQKEILKVKNTHFVVVIGDPNHPEVKGLVGCYNRGCVLSSTDEWASFIQDPSTPKEPILLVAQSTCDPTLYKSITDSASTYPGISIVNSICNATIARQDALRELCGQVSTVLVLGGKKSANTCKLADIARESGVEVYHIEGSEDIPKELYTRKRIGIALGASTPKDQLERVITQLRGTYEG